MTYRRMSDIEHAFRLMVQSASLKPPKIAPIEPTKIRGGPMNDPTGRERLRRLNARVAADNSVILQAVHEARMSGRSATIAFPDCTVTLIVKPIRVGMRGPLAQYFVSDEISSFGSGLTREDLSAHRNGCNDPLPHRAPSDCSLTVQP